MSERIVRDVDAAIVAGHLLGLAKSPGGTLREVDREALVVASVALQERAGGQIHADVLEGLPLYKGGTLDLVRMGWAPAGGGR